MALNKTQVRKLADRAYWTEFGIRIATTRSREAARGEDFGKAAEESAVAVRLNAALNELWSVCRLLDVEEQVKEALVKVREEN